MDFSLILPILVTAVGLFLLVKLRCFFILHPLTTAKELIVALQDREARRSFFLALAGTLGVGNIFGVAAGLMIGGAGSLFWLFLSTFFAMIIKYAETLLVFDERISRGGMSRLLKKVFPSRKGAVMSRLYATLMLLLALFMGSAMQSAAFVDVTWQTLHIHPALSSFILVIILLPCLVGGVSKIEKITEIIIPLTTIIYIMMCLVVVFCNFSRLGEVINMIISSAFSFEGALGGGISFLAVKEGFARGILSNEAGVGTSAMAHARSQGRSPHVAGLFAMCEVIFDSSLLCMLTGFAILLSVPDVTAFSTPMSLVGYAIYSVLGDFASLLLPFVILSFAYATIICWYFYGRECTSLYFPFLNKVYPFAFVFCIVISRAFRSDFLLYTVDVLLLWMSIMTLSAIIKRHPRISEISPHMKTKKPE